MAVVVTSKIPGGTAEQAKRWFDMGIEDRLREQPGLILHAAGPGDGGWQIVSVWETEKDFQRYFDQHVKPNLPPGPDAGQSQTHEVTSLVVGQRAAALSAARA